MKIPSILLPLILIVNAAYAGVVIKTTGGREINWDNYQEEGDKYCTYRSSGKICLNKKDVADVENVIEPQSSADATVIYRDDKKAGPDIKRLSPKDGSEIPEGGLSREAQSICYERVMGLVALIHHYGESRKCEVFKAEPLYYTIANDNWHVYTFRAECREPDQKKTKELHPSCSAIRGNGRWTAYLDKY